jgi:hypothetical protein
MWSKKQSTKDPVSKIMTNSELTNCELLFCWLDYVQVQKFSSKATTPYPGGIRFCDPWAVKIAGINDTTRLRCHRGDNPTTSEFETTAPALLYVCMYVCVCRLCM